MIVAASGGSRDEDVDVSILAGLAEARQPEVFLNERLMSDLRPTLFLGQLPNLLAGNISIVHGVTGSSRTFMGEDAGVDAVRIALARIEAGQSDIALVGGGYNGQRRGSLLLAASGGMALREPFAPVWQRAERGGGMALGSIGAFLVLEAREHAIARDTKPLARLVKVLGEHSRRQAGDAAATLIRMWQSLGIGPGPTAVISGATGAEPATAEERRFLKSLGGIPVRATGTHIGHGFEPQFLMNIGIAALTMAHGRLFPPADASGVEQAMQEPPDKIVVTNVGYWRGEGMALVEPVR
jgi:3-oxoacyl-[acyl-carrier-protein] synthase II